MDFMLQVPQAAAQVNITSTPFHGIPGHDTVTLLKAGIGSGSAF